MIFRGIIPHDVKSIFLGAMLILSSASFPWVTSSLASNILDQTNGRDQTSQSSIETAGIRRAQLTGFHVVGTEESVRLVLDMSSDVRAQTILLSAPYRLVVDLPDTEFAFKSRRNNGSPGFLKKVSFGTVDDALSRLVIESTTPFRIDKKFVVPNSNGSGNRLVIDLMKSSENAFRLFVAKQAEEHRLAKLRLEEQKKEEQRLKQQKTTEQSKPAEERVAARPKIKRRIVIDPGHGGKDGGAKALSGVLEKDVVLSFAKKLAQNLKESEDLEVIMTRTGDEFVRLDERVRIARQNNVDLFVSIHADSFPSDRRIRGMAIYTISEKASDALAAAIADQNNKSDAIAGHDIINGPDEVIDILFDLTRRESSNLSIVFARHFFQSMRAETRFFKNPLQRAAFRVLRVPDVPSVLIELGFLSNAQDAKLLASKKWRDEHAEKIAKTIKDYFDKPVIGLNQ